MSPGESGAPEGLGATPNARRLIEEWVESLAQVLESMTDQRPQVRWQAASGALAEAGSGLGDEILWWEQPFTAGPSVAAWVAAPRAAWEQAGGLTLKAAGLETSDPGEAKDTWYEILGQSLAAMARSVGSLVGREVTCEGGAQRAPGPEIQDWVSVSLGFGESPPAPLLLAFSRPLVATISAPPPSPEPEPGESVPEPAAAGGARTAPAISRTMELLLEVDLPVSISFGKAHLAMKDVLKLTTGSIVELNRGVNEPVDVLVNQCLIARGEVVVVDGNYGVRIQEIASRHDRLRSIP